MDRLGLSPTKSNLLKVRQDLAVAREGWGLLEQKREVLALELMARLEEVRRLEAEIETRLGTAYPALRELLCQLGREEATRVSAGVRYEFRLEARPLRVAGIWFTTLELQEPALKPQFGLDGSRASCDVAMLEFLALLKLLARMAAIRGIVWRLAAELKKAQRRVNALEKLVIPRTEACRVFIEGALEEKERDAFYSRKLLKRRKDESR